MFFRIAPSSSAIALVLASSLSRPAAAAPSDRFDVRAAALWGGGLTAAAFLLDRPVHRRLNPARGGEVAKIFGDGDFGRTGSGVEMAGRLEWTLAAAAVFYGAGAATNSSRAQRVGIAGAEAALASGAATLALKVAAGRSRPYRGEGPGRFRLFGGRNTSTSSFPSGHAAVSFSMAAAVADEYDSAGVDVLAYGTASAVALGRVYQERHWTSDVAAGAALGVAAGKYFRRRAALKGGPFVMTDGKEIELVWTF